MKPKSAIQKGKLLEDYVADQIVDKGLDNKASRSIGSGSGNREKSDIDTSLMMLGRNVGFECKNQKKLDLLNWWKQTEKLQTLNREPVLVMKFPRESLGETKALIYLDSLLNLIKLSKDPAEFKQDRSDNRELVWALEGLKSACNKVIKLIK